MKPKIKQKIKEIIAEQLILPIEIITFKSLLIDDLGADELDMLEIADALQEEFGITIWDDELDEIETVSDIIKYIEDYSK